MTTTTRPTAPPEAYAKAALVALALSLTAGAVAGWVRSDEFWLVAVVFAVCTLGPAIALGWLIFVSGHTVQPDPHVEDSVEARWVERACSGAFIDLVVAAGVALTLTSVLDLEVPGGLVLLAVVAGAGIDAVLRYAVISRRES
ncbi:hypothetical protein ASG73_03240 [Janibacter sp. Soil728]|uniref:hypothetical protein n=1 Tax=Janibacter sp. Soil728 TaxID=1736393 RepID=UPI0006F8CA59|nr:hypothetical protein [Janibacter sp. Soil728]KRE39355.1 hypothetical protein ASG73_03240 [Janibacter sp. Soil728]